MQVEPPRVSLPYLSVHEVKKQLESAVLRARHGEHGAELEEDIGCHGVDPERKSCERVESEISDSQAGPGVLRQHSARMSLLYLYGRQSSYICTLGDHDLWHGGIL